MSKISNIADALLSQPPSFAKKKHYEILDVLGTGSFGKVMVRCDACLLYLVYKHELIVCSLRTGGEVACPREYG